MAKLIIESGEGRGRKYQIGGSVFIGRSKKNQIHIDDQAISRRHTKIVLKDGEFHLQDLGSKNGTLLNGQVIQDLVRLKPGDKIRVGGNVILFADDNYKSPQLATPAAGSMPEVTMVARAGDEDPGEDFEAEETIKETHRPTLRRAASEPAVKVPAFAAFLYYAALFVAALLAAHALFLPILKNS